MLHSKHEEGPMETSVINVPPSHSILVVCRLYSFPEPESITETG